LKRTSSFDEHSWSDVVNINITDTTTTIITTAAGLEEKIKASVSFQIQISKDQNQDK
jgi:hypothetical protein